MKRSPALFFILIWTFHAQAAELTIVGGEAGPQSCRSEPSARLDLARSNARAKLGDPTRYRQVSAWDELAYEVGRPYAPDSCRHADAWAFASFVELKDADAEWEVVTNGDFTNPRSEPKLETEAWARATEDALKKAQFFCGGAAESRPLHVQATKKDFNGEGWYTLYSIRAKFRCIKPVICNPTSPYCAR